MYTASPPRIAIITTVHGPFDVRVFHRQARSLAAAGYETYVLARHHSSESVDGVHIRALPRLPWRPLRPLVWIVALIEALKLRADVYHIHDPELLLIGYLLQMIVRSPVIYDSHEYLQESILTKGWIPAPLRPLLSVAAGRMEKAFARRMAAVVVVNSHMAGTFQGARSVVVHNFPLLEYFGDEDGVPLDRSPVVIYVGGQNRQRGLGLMLDAGRLIRSAVPQARVQILGPVDWSGIPNSQRRDLKGRRERPVVEFLGTVPQDEVSAFLDRAALGWIPWLETPNNVRGLPNKLFEYMAAGLPVVAPAYGAMAQVIGEVGCGLLARAGDHEDHAAKVSYLLQHPNEAALMGRRGRQAVCARYNWTAEKRNLLALYEDLAGLPSTSGVDRPPASKS